MNIFKTLFITVFLACASNNLVAKKIDNKFSDVKKLFSYFDTHNDYFLKNNIDNKIDLFQKNIKIELSEKQIICIKSSICPINIKFDKVVLYSSNSSSDFSKLESQLTDYFKVDFLVYKKTKHYINYMFFAPIILLLAIGLIFFRSKKYIKHRYQLKKSEGEIKILLKSNQELGDNINGMLFLFNKSNLELTELRKSYEMTQRLPPKLSQTLIQKSELSLDNDGSDKPLVTP